MIRKNAKTFVLIGVKTRNLVRTYVGQVSNSTTLAFLKNMKNHTFISGQYQDFRMGKNTKMVFIKYMFNKHTPCGYIFDIQLVLSS